MTNNIQYIQEQLSECITVRISLHNKIPELNSMLTRQKAYLEEVNAANHEISKLNDIIRVLESFDSSKIKTCGIKNPITPDLIKSVRLYNSELIRSIRTTNEVNRDIENTNRDIASTQQSIKQATERITHLKQSLLKEQQELNRKLADINYLLDECNRYKD